MRARRIAAVLALASLAGAGTGAQASQPLRGEAASKCLAPFTLHYRGRAYEARILTRRPPLGRRLGIGLEIECRDVGPTCFVGEPCDPPPSPRERVRLARLAGIRPSAAVGRRDLPERIYVAEPRCKRLRPEARLRACLRTAR